MSSVPRYELRRDPQSGTWRVWCNEKGADGKPRGWDNHDGSATYDDYWPAQRRVNWLNWADGPKMDGQKAGVSSPEQAQAYHRAQARAALEKAGREYLERTRHQLLKRKGDGQHERASQDGSAAPDGSGAGDGGGEAAAGTGGA